MTRRWWNPIGSLLVAIALVGGMPAPAPAAAQPVLCSNCTARPTPEIDPGALRGAVLVLAGVGLMVADRRRRT